MNGASSELVDFLLPKLDDPLQVGFLSIIGLMMVYTTISAHMAARPASWEKKWNRGTPDRHDDDLDIEHGSVTDLWHAVATSSEKLAEIMPGLLLVVGLLGTFLGLGMALNHASNILGQSNAIADGMGDLLGLLKGLGTKFKTSTWGILGYVLLKIWSEVTRFEEKRLVWVIDKVKVELERRKKESLATEEMRLQSLFAQISNASAHIVDGIRIALAQAGSNQQKLLVEVNNTLQVSQKKSEELHRESSKQRDFNAVEVKKSLDAVHNALVQAQDQNTARQEALIEQFGNANKKLASIDKENKASSAALIQFTEGTQEIVQQMADAAEKMAEGSDKVSSAAVGLQKVVDEFGQEFQKVLDEVGTDLSSAIGQMSTVSATTLTEGSNKLESATKEISRALIALSEKLEGSMGKVEKSVADALDLQKKTAKEFVVSSNTLSENIQETTENSKRLGENITAGLESVAAAGQQMRSIGNNLKEQAPMLERIASQDSLSAIPDAIEKMTDGINKLTSILDRDNRLQVPEAKSQ